MAVPTTVQVGMEIMNNSAFPPPMARWRCRSENRYEQVPWFSVTGQTRAVWGETFHSGWLTGEARCDNTQTWEEWLMANNYQFWDLGGLAMDVPGGNTTPGAAILQIYQQN